MESRPVIFRYEPRRLARLLTSDRCRMIELDASDLVLVDVRGNDRRVAADDVTSNIELKKGLIWSTVRFTAQGLGKVRLGGIPHERAQRLQQALEAWVAPAWQRKAGRFLEESTRVEGLVGKLLLCLRYVRKSELTSAIAAIESIVERNAAEAMAPYLPRDVQASYADLARRVGSLATEVRTANDRFVGTELTRHQALFDSVESKPLTPAQRRSCVINDDHNLVLAGAGTGKTSVMIGRVGYLLTTGLSTPSTTLMVAYNRDAARELRERAAARLAGVPGADQLTIKTFHALGKEILAEVEGVQPSVSPLAEDGAKMSAFVTGLLDEALKDPDYAAKFIEYGFDLNQPHRFLFDFKSMAEYERELARLDLRTLQGDRVKSHEEVRIANFLTRHGVEYEYEKPFTLRTEDRYHRQYRPDFTISRESPDDGPDLGPVFLEHFGVDAKGKPPSFFGEQQAQAYRDGMSWKRSLYTEHQLPLIETYSYQFRPEVVFDHLTRQLAQHGVTLQPRTDAECLDMLRGTAVVTDTAKLFADLIPIIREHGIGHVEIDRRIGRVPEGERGRARLLWELLCPIKERYEQQLATAGDVDFADMIRKATELVRGGQYRSPFTHLLVDEFQDISGPRAELVVALARQRPDSTVFCVGDDWQSIYRFAGSDIRYTGEFEKRVGPGTITALDRTFRFNNQIGRVASEFVTRNPQQSRKHIESVVTVAEPAVSLVPTAEPQLGLEAILRRIDQFSVRDGHRHSVYVLARYWYELEELQAHYRSRGGYGLRHLEKVEFRTVHGVKGREADYVLIVGLEAGRNGFPADKATDPFHEMFLPPRENFEFAEERRLFYVALTRARHRVYLVFDAVSHSPFVRELREGGYPIEEHELSGDFVKAVLPVVPCPRCATGELQPRSGPHGVFYACNRFPACKYRERGCGSCGGLLLKVGQYRVCSIPHCNGVHLECPKCRAPMEHRSGRYGAFFGCSNYGRIDVIEQCAATEKWRALPSAEELRRQLS